MRSSVKHQYHNKNITMLATLPSLDKKLKSFILTTYNAFSAYKAIYVMIFPFY